MGNRFACVRDTVNTPTSPSGSGTRRAGLIRTPTLSWW